MPAVDQARDSDLAGDLALLIEAAREAGRIALRFFRQSPEVWMKGGTSPVSEADYAADKYLNETLLAARPDYGWLSEETTDDAARLSARRTFVVDPIDGTRGFLEGRREWCVFDSRRRAGPVDRRRARMSGEERDVSRRFWAAAPSRTEKGCW